MHIPVMQYRQDEMTEKISAITLDPQIDTNKSMEILFSYSIFPHSIMSFLTQWKYERRPMKVGDTIVQQVYLPPIRSFSVKVLFGVRISNIIDTVEKKGFSYQTLEGHVEKGESTFTFETQGRDLIFKIHTFSSSGNALTKLLGPIFSQPYQTYCTRQALKNIKHRIS
jgi:uncharacterized protein (UPF0548 family)